MKSTPAHNDIETDQQQSGLHRASLTAFISPKVRLRLYIAFWFAIAIGFVISVLAQSYRYEALLAQEALLQEQIAAAQQVARQLQRDLQYHYSDAFVERIARDQLGFIRADEIIFINDAR
ncbi:MAG: septum formation initiator family protein [Defluviitaleaceae bacterium]|nr:septum formation initiator family protein [Defluviitaleaceae bacterium]